MREGAQQEGTSDGAYSRNQPPSSKMTRNRAAAKHSAITRRSKHQANLTSGTLERKKACKGGAGRKVVREERTRHGGPRAPSAFTRWAAARQPSSGWRAGANASALQALAKAGAEERTRTFTPLRAP